MTFKKKVMGTWALVSLSASQRKQKNIQEKIRHCDTINDLKAK